MTRSLHGFDHTTAAGQIRLMRLSMGQDYDVTRAPEPVPRDVATRPVPTDYTELGRRVRAVWKPHRFAAVTEGVVVNVDRVFESDRLRLVILQGDGMTQRCYTNDPDWVITFLADKAELAVAPEVSSSR